MKKQIWYNPYSNEVFEVGEDIIDRCFNCGFIGEAEYFVDDGDGRIYLGDTPSWLYEKNWEFIGEL